MRSFLFGLQWPLSCCVFIRSFLCVYTLMVSFSLRENSPILSDQGDILLTSFNPKYFLKFLSPNAVMLRVRASVCEFWGDHSVCTGSVLAQGSYILLPDVYNHQRIFKKPMPRPQTGTIKSESSRPGKGIISTFQKLPV